MLPHNKRFDTSGPTFSLKIQVSDKPLEFFFRPFC